MFCCYLLKSLNRGREEQGGASSATLALMGLSLAVNQTTYSSIRYLQVDEFMFLELERSAQNTVLAWQWENRKQWQFLFSMAPLQSHTIGLQWHRSLGSTETSRYLLLGIIEGATNNNYIVAN